jgi:amino acid transporter
LCRVDLVSLDLISTKKSSTFNMVMTVLHIVFVLFIIVAGFVKGDSKNLTTAGAAAAAPMDDATSRSGFAPFGIRGVFNGAAIVYFSYIGYDAVSTTAEEVKNPAKNMPLGVSGSVIIVTILYCLIALALCMLQPYDMIDSGAPFSTAFRQIAGWEWASNCIGAGASLGILTSLLVAMLGQARYLCVLGRAHVVPYWFATVNSFTNTPVNATIFLGMCTALICFFTDLQVLLSLISIGTLFVFYMVANALIYRRHVVVGKTNPLPTLAYLTALTTLAACFVIVWQSMDSTSTVATTTTTSVNDNSYSSCSGSAALLLVCCASLSIFITGVFWWKVPSVHKGKEWTVPCMPWIAAASIYLNVFLLGSVDTDSYIRFAIWTALAVVFYFVYGVHSTHDAEMRALDLEDLEEDHQVTTCKSTAGYCSCLISLVVEFNSATEDHVTVNMMDSKLPSSGNSSTAQSLDINPPAATCDTSCFEPQLINPNNIPAVSPEYIAIPASRR